MKNPFNRIDVNVKGDCKAKAITFLYFAGIFIYLELSLHLMIFRTVDIKILYPLICSFAAGGILYLISTLFTPKVNRVVMIILISVITLYYETQLVYHLIFGSFMPVSQIGLGGDAVANFAPQILHAVSNNIVFVIIGALPLPISIFLLCKGIIKTHRTKLLQWACALIITGVFIAAFTFSLSAVGQLWQSPYLSTEASVKTFGAAATAYHELLGVLLPDDAVFSFKPTTLDDIGRSQNEVNTTDIDFTDLSLAAEDDIHKQIDNYLASVAPSEKNEYTGIARGYNLITVCAEGFSPYVIDPVLTPTLYKLSNNGIVFKNFYNSFPNTTTNGEYTFNMGLFPDMSRNKVDNSFNASADNYLPYCLGNIYGDMGYNAYAYHNYYATFYDRHITHTNMGYDFRAVSRGLDIKVGSPSSDLDMINASMPDYLDSDKPFHVYYMTYSGHYQYNWENQMSAKNRDKVEHLPYSDGVKAYIACNLELEYALEALLEGLERAGKADNTVIVLTGDHYPYGLSQNQYDELAGFAVDTVFEKYRNSFICYIPGIERVEVEAYCSTQDILPTILNIMGIDFDSRLLCGRDVLSSAPHIAVLSDLSFICDELRYNAVSGEVIFADGKEVGQDTVKDYCNYVENMFTLSQMILDSDYYAHVFGKNAAQKAEQAFNFTDITDNNVYVESTVTYVMEKGYMDPLREDYFGVANQAVIYDLTEGLYRAEGSPAEYENSSEWAYKNKLISNIKQVNMPLTTIEAANIIYKYMGRGEQLDITQEKLLYPELDDSDILAIKWCNQKEIVMGIPQHTPYELARESVTRYQAAAYLQRITG